jgi:hypothetical protein
MYFEKEGVPPLNDTDCRRTKHRLHQVFKKHLAWMTRSKRKTISPHLDIHN